MTAVETHDAIPILGCKNWGSRLSRAGSHLKGQAGWRLMPTVDRTRGPSHSAGLPVGFPALEFRNLSLWEPRPPCRTVNTAMKTYRRVFVLLCHFDWGIGVVHTVHLSFSLHPGPSSAFLPAGPPGVSSSPPSLLILSAPLDRQPILYLRHLVARQQASYLPHCVSVSMTTSIAQRKGGKVRWW